MLICFFSILFMYAEGGGRQLQTGRTQVPLVLTVIHRHFYPKDILQLFGLAFV